MAGTYDLAGGSSGSQLKFNHGGSSGAPITLESDPGQLATLSGGPVYVPHGSDYVTITGLRINTVGTEQVGVQIMGADDALTYDDITNLNSRGSCVILGSDTGYGQAADTLVANDVIHQCGYNPGDPFEDHGVYADNVVNATITQNVMWGMPYGWGVQLYPHSIGAQVTHNVIDDNGQGVVVGGNRQYTSSDNTVAYNIITHSTHQYDIQSWWGGAVGTGNVASNNCLYSGAAGDVQPERVGFTATANLTADPNYADPAQHDYTLAPGSPCLAVVGYDAAAAIAGRSVPRATSARAKHQSAVARPTARPRGAAQAQRATRHRAGRQHRLGRRHHRRHRGHPRRPGA